MCTKIAVWEDGGSLGTGVYKTDDDYTISKVNGYHETSEGVIVGMPWALFNERGEMVDFARNVDQLAARNGIILEDAV
jgi:hypothetical protein